MAGSICNRLINKAWKSFSDDLDSIPKAKGIYTIGLKKRSGSVEYIYVGHSTDMHRRVPEHTRPVLAIDKFVQEQIEKDGGVKLQIKWVEDKDAKCREGEYIDCMEEKLGYHPAFNMKGGNKC